jgi:hypothetical protein
MDDIVLNNKATKEPGSVDGWMLTMVPSPSAVTPKIDRKTLAQGWSMQNIYNSKVFLIGQPGYYVINILQWKFLAGIWMLDYYILI